MTSGGVVERFLHCDPLEVAVGWVYGSRPVARPNPSRSARVALDDAIRPALQHGPCYVTFSGGRDSSAVLAAATDLARREGHDLPVPITRVYPDLQDTDETSWQRAVVDHLALSEWLRLELRQGESDLLGPAARAGLQARGSIWPPALQTHGVMFEHARGGSLLTGEGGDAVLGSHRGTPLARLRHGRPPSRALLKLTAGAVLPRPVRRQRIAALAVQSVQSRWLQPDALREHVRRIADDESDESLRSDSATWAVATKRSFATISHNHAVVAAEYGIRASDPLLDHRFVSTLARDGGRLGFTSRTATMRFLFADILPAAVLSRATKARFNLAHAAEATRRFACDWDGTGVDRDLVDVDRLRDVWLSDQPTMATGMLLHAAWLRTIGHAG